MKDFAALITKLDQTTKTLKKLAALKEFFAVASDSDKVWTLALLTGKRPKRTVRTSLLREWSAEAGNIPQWLFEESYYVVGDLGETMSLLHPNQETRENKTLDHWIRQITGLQDHSDAEKKIIIMEAWNQMNQTERFVFNKLIAGSFRIGVSQKLIVRALAQFAEVEENILAHRLMGNWNPAVISYHDLVYDTNQEDDNSRPYPFYLAYALEKEVGELGSPEEWQAERKWDGIRGQLIIRGGKLYVWSRGEELVTDKFPEYEILTALLPDGTVIDGEILPYKEGKPLSFNVLQTRIGRKNVSQKILNDAPVILMAYDLLEFDGKDIRETPLRKRRNLLEKLVAKVNETSQILRLSETVAYQNWDQLAQEREESRKHLSEGIMLKHKDSTYKVGRKKGDWWKWKVDPLTVDAVMIYAMRGHGRRANLYTDYTFAVWKGEELIPFTKAYSGLSDQEIRKVDNFVKRNTIDRFGPVRSVVPTHVFEIAFEGIAYSSRHKSGIALRFPRINRWRHDKKIEEANTLEDLHQLLKVYHAVES